MSGPIVTIFRSHVREEELEDYAATAGEMEKRARAMPGFRRVKGFRAEDGERVTLVEFESWETHDAWARDPAHREAQRLGRERYYARFELQVAEPTRAISFEREDPA